MIDPLQGMAAVLHTSAHHHAMLPCSPSLAPHPFRFPLLACLQGAQIMSQYGINVPPGIPVFKVDEVPAAAEKMKDENGDVSLPACL